MAVCDIIVCDVKHGTSGIGHLFDIIHGKTFDAWAFEDYYMETLCIVVWRDFDRF